MEYYADVEDTHDAAPAADGQQKSLASIPPVASANQAYSAKLLQELLKGFDGTVAVSSPFPLVYFSPPHC